MTWQALMKEELERLRQADIPEADSDIRLLARMWRAVHIQH